MRIAIARLRSYVRYKEPLHDILDSYYYLLKLYMRSNPQHDYMFYNITFDGTKPWRNNFAIANCDAIIIPSEAEFRYHIPGQMHPQQLKRSNEAVAELNPYIKDKRIIVLRSDRADNEELYRKVFPVPFEYREIDETDFPNNIHGIKYYFINNANAKRNVLFPEEDEIKYKFIYWGWDKRKDLDGKPSGDIRHEVLKNIQKALREKSFFVGHFGSMSKDMKGVDMIDLLPYLNKSLATICFNWKSNTATTSRYTEAVASGVFPFVWKDYDINNTLVASDFQRIHSAQDFLDKINVLMYDDTHEKFGEVQKKFFSTLPTIDDYYNQFEYALNESLEGTHETYFKALLREEHGTTGVSGQ
jgi:hypothetical protein